ncbi:hypothetical protein [Erythrobacter aureus]|uniref:Co-chaperone DjlA N-terminal domain-containing protein n=1 Tax=Erythrobacter aureus TaxID=2182384 RepID=A0A345YJI6_9SPHN|nr:hypothetical protein [Erythrobacter aureus]AXK44088.1 hypothetical protein DVR09_16680 [Erythrobacter aureus]
MFFLPILVALIAFLLFPSVLLAGGLGTLTWLYLTFAGQSNTSRDVLIRRGKIAYRLLSVKLLTLNGDMNDDTYKVHGLLTPDEPETAELRNLLRNAAFTTGDGWKHWAREVRRVYKNEPTIILDRFEMLVVQLKASAAPVSDESQGRLVEIAKLWGIGPEKVREYLAKMEIQPSAAVAAW